MPENCLQVLKNDKVGRYATASKDLQAGDVVFEEEPFAYGPKSGHPPMCLGCYLPVDCSYLCSKCSWPVCNAQCQENATHANNECKVFAESGAKFQTMADPTDICLQFECITPLRVLLAMEANKQRWDSEVACMQSHCEIRKSKPIWAFNQNNVVEYLRGPCKLTRFSEELIHRVCGILDVNSFEAHPSTGGYSIRCLYPNLAILSHNCVANTTHTIFQDLKVQCRTSVPLKKDQELYSSYAYTILPTLVRRAYLEESKYFLCDCLRCKDATELGTHLGTLKCSKCDNGVLISTEPLNFEAEWKCTHCDFRTKATAVRRVYEAIQMELDNVDANVEEPAEAIEARETLYRKYRSVMHPRNAYHTMLRLSLAQMYGKLDGYIIEDLPDLLLERKVELCMQILENLDVIEPGYTRTRGLILYELHAPLILIAKNLYKNAVITKEELKRKLNEAAEKLEEAVKILCLEPEYTQEGMLGRNAKPALERIKESFFDEILNADL
ncbi:SET domain-containing protein SmydA-8-like [Atheta coriaria]|uniref:SET domain-containing protein SmydA-8-like n=1 Tax=Dalotia coriaria TaxID=877792 RepID=UPI0031F4485E